MGNADSTRIELAISDLSQLGALDRFLNWAAPGASVSRTAANPDPGELGAVDVLALVASSSGLVTAIKVLPEFLRSRRTGLSITATIRGEPVQLTATNVDEVLPILERLLEAGEQADSRGREGT